MPLAAADSVRVQWTGTGTGTMALGPAVSGFQAFPASLDGRPVSYAIETEDSLQRENGIGTYTASGPTLTRDLVTYSTAGAPTKQSFSAGTKHVRLVALARDVVENRATVDPTATDDITQGYIAGRSRWLNTTTNALFICVNHTATVAVWALVTSQAQIATLVALDTDDGGTFNPAAIDLSANKEYDPITQVGAWAFALAAVTEVPGAWTSVEVTGNGSAITYSADFVAVDGSDLTVAPYSGFTGTRRLMVMWSGTQSKALVALSGTAGGTALQPATAGTTFDPTACAFDRHRTYQPLTVSANEQFSLAGGVTPINGSFILVTVTFSGNPTLTWDAAFVAATDDLNGSLPTTVTPGTYALTFTYAVIGSAGAGRVRVEGFPVEPAAHTHELADILGPAILTDDEETASFTLALTHADQKMIRCNHASTPIIVTVPPNSSVMFPVGTVLTFVQWGAASVTFNQGSGVTIRPGDDYMIDLQYGVASLWQQSINTWLLYGNIEAA